QDAHRAIGVRDHHLTRGQRAAVPAEALARRRHAQPERAGELVVVEGHDRDARLDGRDQQRVVQQVAAREAARAHAFEGDLLDRRPVLVGVDAHLPEEDAVRPRDGLLPEGHRLPAREAVGEVAESLPDRLGAAARARLEPYVEEAKLGELGGQVVRHPSDLDLRGLDHRTPRPFTIARTAALNCASETAPRRVPAEIPPRRAKMVVGQSPMPYRLNTAASRSSATGNPQPWERTMLRASDSDLRLITPTNPTPGKERRTRSTRSSCASQPEPPVATNVRTSGRARRSHRLTTPRRCTEHAARWPPPALGWMLA